jgi:ketosteroid isomerase-like protein
MVDRDYTEDAVLVTFFNGFDTPPPLTIKGREGIKKFFHEYMNTIGTIDVKTLGFTETEDAIFFQATFTCNLGLATVGDAWYMRNGQIAYHFGFWV